MEGHFFRGGRWVIDLNEQDAKNHLHSINLSQDVQLIMNYFIYLLYVETPELGDNELSERHDEIKEAIVAIMSQRYDSGARQISAIIEGIVRDSLFNDGCIDNSTPYPQWTGDFHEHSQPKNFYQILEGALRDPRSRIGRTIDYPPEQEIYHVSEMIRNPLAHGSQTVAILEDYKVLLFILVLLFHDIVNPHNYPGDHKYLKWISRTQINMRLRGENPTLEKILEVAEQQGLNIAKVQEVYQ